VRARPWIGGLKQTGEWRLSVRCRPWAISGRRAVEAAGPLWVMSGRAEPIGSFSA